MNRIDQTHEKDQHAHCWLKDLADQGRVKGVYLAKRKSLGTTRGGKPFLTVVLSDRTGDVEAKVWERAEEVSSRFREGDVIQIEGEAGSYRGQVQVKILDLAPFEGEVEPDVFMETSPEDPSHMMRDLRTLLRKVENRHLRVLVERFLGDRQFTAQFRRAPAAKNFHHNYIGGLLEHTLSVCQLADQVARHYSQLDRDVMLSAGFLHDVGKVREFTYHLKIDYTDEGRLLGHVVIGAQMVDEQVAGIKDFPQDLGVLVKHLILSHHGEYEFGSPKRPKSLEAYALHLMDDLDAKMNGLSRFMERDRQEGAWTEFNRMFSRFFLKGEIASNGVQAPEEEEEEGGSEEQVSLFFSE